MLTGQPSLRMFLGFLLSSFVLVSCGGSSGGSSKDRSEPPPGPSVPPPPNPPNPPDPAVVTVDPQLSIRQNLVIYFDKKMDPTSLDVQGSLVDLSAPPVWNSDNTQLTFSPADGAWESGRINISGTVTDKDGLPTALSYGFDVRLVFETFQQAEVVIGQPDFSSGAANQGASPGANTLNIPFGSPSFYNGRLWIGDWANNRVLGFDGIPVINNESASWLVGQPDFVTTSAGVSATEVSGPQLAVEYEGRLYVTDWSNHRINIFDPVPLALPAVASRVIGQPDLDTADRACGPHGLYEPESLLYVDGKLVVSDSGNNRVLIWNTVPADTNAVPPDVVLGQSRMDTCAANDDAQYGIPTMVATSRTLNGPSGMWSDGERLIVSDADNNRVLIWNTFPSASFQPADVVLGQADFDSSTRNDDDGDGVEDIAPTARTFNDPYLGIWSNGLQLILSDSSNNRVLIWNSFPTENFQPADEILGQSDFTLAAGNDDDQDGIDDGNPSSRTFSYPAGLTVHRDKLLIADVDNNRVLVFSAK